MANILDNSSSDNSNTNQWLASLNSTGISTTTANNNNNNNNNNIPASFIDTKPPSIHSRPHRENDSLRTDNDIPPLQDYNNLNNNDNNNTSTDSSGNPTIGGDIGSRADVFAGVIIFSTGMLVLIAAMIFYFVNGRSWRSAKRRQQQHTEESSALEKGIELDNDNEDHNDNNNNNTLQEKKEEHYSNEDISTTCVMNDNDHGNDYIQQSFNSSNNNSNVDSKELEVPLSPSTAPLADVPTKSVFSFLKGTQRNPSISSTISDSNTDDPLASTMIMPALTRTKARSSVKSKSDSNMSQQQQQQKPRSINAEEILQNHVAIDMIQEPELLLSPLTNPITTDNNDNNDSNSNYNNNNNSYNSNNNSNNSTNNNNSNDNNDDNDSTTCSDSTGALYLSRKNHTTLSSPSSSSSSRAHMHRSSRNSTVPTLLRLDMPPQTNPSIIGLYGSAKSSPNGSLADAASVQAIYSHSLRSVMSFATHADSTSAMDCPDTESKEVVLASADMKLERD
ncbi:hypothetical protein BGZ46_003056 [Entomortierella lignicola]|nr:hypothetical protein BGZ46_003056 [Entomortierella lignicola]